MSDDVTERDWYAEIDAWTERFTRTDDPPEPFATALRDGWTEAAKECLARDAADYHAKQAGYLTPPPPMPICPACRHTLNMVTPFFLQSMNLTVDDLVDASVPFTPPD
jgi:hypothetical protein